MGMRESYRETILTQKYLNECFEYKDGELIWKERPTHHFVDEWRQKIFNKKMIGKTAGSSVQGYKQIYFEGAGKVAAHRVIFLMHHGTLPEFIDHIDGNPSNNRIENLREATHFQNMKNAKLRVDNKTGRKGVYRVTNYDRWFATIRADGKSHYLGSFDSFEDACAAREAAEEKYHGKFARAA